MNTYAKPDNTTSTVIIKYINENVEDMSCENLVFTLRNLREIIFKDEIYMQINWNVVEKHLTKYYKDSDVKDFEFHT